MKDPWILRTEKIACCLVGILWPSPGMLCENAGRDSISQRAMITPPGCQSTPVASGNCNKRWASKLRSSIAIF